jgi:hypothetical protein
MFPGLMPTVPLKRGGQGTGRDGSEGRGEGRVGDGSAGKGDDANSFLGGWTPLIWAEDVERHGQM